MSTYNDNLRTTVNTTLAGIDAEEQKRDSALTVAHYNLYYAVGSQIRAQDKRDSVDKSYQRTWDIDHQGVSCNNSAANLLTTATNADQNVTATVTNSATAASNVQIAANAVLKVAAGIGSANNIVTASDYETDIQLMTSYANTVIGQTAYQAELASQMSMQTSADAAQIIAKQVLEEATATKTEFDNMLGATQAELNKLTETRTADTTALIAANTTQRSTEGSLKVAVQEHSAVQSSYDASNNTLNYDLRANTANAFYRVPTGDDPTAEETARSLSPTSLTTVKVYFEAFVPPFAITDAQGHPIELTNEYFMAVAKADTAGMYTFDVVETTFHNHQASRFVQVQPGGPTNLANNVVLRGAAQTGDLQLLNDINGKPIEPGTPYVVLLYIALDQAYKKATNNFSDQLSAPSLPFTLATTLAQVTESDRLAGNTTFTFTVVPGINNPTTEYRCIMVPNHSLCHSDNDDCDPLTSVGIWFDLEIAKQVAQVNYQVATLVSGTTHTYQFGVSDTTTDNFGQFLVARDPSNVDAASPQGKYIPMVLSIVSPLAANPSGEPIANQYLAKLTLLSEYIYLLPEIPVVETPVDETPVVETPVIEAPVVAAPVVEAPVVAAPVVEAPKADTPKADTPKAEVVTPKTDAAKPKADAAPTKVAPKPEDKSDKTQNRGRGRGKN